MSAAALKQRLRADLKSAMQAKAADEVRTLRRLIGALDNAEAVPVAEEKYRTRTFGEAGIEVARRELDQAAVDALLLAEVEARLTAAEDYDRHSRDDEAARLRHEAGLIAAYRAP